MKKEIADKWIEALRSGKYKQGRKYLCTVKGKTAKYCCLGVLCHILGTPYVKDGPLKRYGSVREAAGLPECVQGKTGIQSVLGDIQRLNTSLDCLAFENDKGKSFKEIANIIEQNWEWL